MSNIIAALDKAERDIRAMAPGVRDKWRAARPDWCNTDSPLKYVDWALDETIAKCRALCTVLHPQEGADVREFGPGACYLLAMLAACGCDAEGYDIPERPLYQDSATALKVRVWDYPITAYLRPSAWKADVVVATQISWMNDWTPEQARDVVSMWAVEANTGGRIVLFPNPQAFGGQDPGAVWAALRPVELTMPLLGRGFIFTRGAAA
jgi:hypothetical protein